MKKIFNAFITLAAVLCIAPVANAQYTHTYDGIGQLYFPKENNDDHGDNADIGASKNISAPVQGTYWIKLEAFAKGHATKTSEPSDFVLVLDVSGSMSERMGGNDNNTRINALKSAVRSFLSKINENDAYDMGGNLRTNRLGNRIGIVTFSTSATKRSDLIELGTSPSDSSGLTTLKNIITNLNANGGTYAHYGMSEAKDMMDFPKVVNGKTRKLRTVVLFTDGVPGLVPSNSNNPWTDGYTLGNYGISSTYYAWGNVRVREDVFKTANQVISYANDIKNFASTYDVTSNVFTVSIITNPQTQTQAYLGKASSNYLSTTSMGDYSNWGNVSTTSAPSAAQWAYGGGNRNTSETNYALSASTSEELKQVFDAIAGIAGSANDTDLSSTTTTVDVISSSFTLSGTSIAPSLIKVYTAPYLYDKNREEGKRLYFGAETLAPGSNDKFDDYEYVKEGTTVTKVFKGQKDVDADITIDADKLKDNIIELKGFDYTDNWCGPIYEDNKVAGAQGHKVIVLIPIQMADDAVGGPNVLTNAEGSGIFRSSTDTDPLIPFTSPAVSLPVNLSVKKLNLKKGENAKFLIQRTTIPARPSDADATWHPDYSQLSGWEYVTSIMVPNKDGSNEVKIKGLPSTSDEGDYVYRIIEEDWSWTYTFKAATGAGYVKNAAGDIEIKDIEIKDKFGVYSDQFVTNPITFSNTEEANSDTRVRHAESKVTNTFKPKSTGSTEGVVTTSDLKTND